METNDADNRMVKEIDVTIRFDGKDEVHTLIFDKDDEELSLSEEEMYELGFCGDIILEDKDGSEITLSIDASNPEFFQGTYIKHLVFNLYPLNQPGKDFERAEVIDYEPVFYE